MHLLKKSFNTLFCASVLLFFLCSCEMDEQFSSVPDVNEDSDYFDVDDDSDYFEEVLKAEDKNIQSAGDLERFRIGHGNLIYEETFESNKPLSTALNMQTSTNHGFSISKNPVFKGLQSGRLELRYNDPLAHGGTRSEIFVIDRISSREMWYSFAAYFPANDYPFDSSNEIISQWHQDGTPALSIRTQSDRFYIRTLPTDKSKKWKNIDLGQINKDTWHEFVIRVIHSGKSDGLIEVWRNGVKVVSHKGPNNEDNEKMPYWKLGLYKASWNSGKPTGSKKRVVYVDNIKVGNSNSSFEEMTPGTSTTQSGPASQPESKPSSSIRFTVIDADIEKAVKTLEDGEVISLGSIGRRKLSVQADFGSKVESAKFELRGAASHTYLDKKVPFCLFGDDGRGDYYFGNRILPTGDYTMTVTGYADVNGRIPVGEPRTIKFRLTN